MSENRLEHRWKQKTLWLDLKRFGPAFAGVLDFLVPLAGCLVYNGAIPMLMYAWISVHSRAHPLCSNL